ncbi:hypothetical protein C8T65DRAFT_671286 [Cerioporus squamosus]|nr:hypothetical protein C8T65DRAFT_671286 [Cerioporus squamosus]
MGPPVLTVTGPIKTGKSKSTLSPVQDNLQHRQRTITILPTRRKFAVVRMDPIFMVSHLDLDSLAIQEAAAMRPKKYLVYIDAPQDLPLPGSEWCHYWVQPIATTLRPAVPEEGITEDMVLPIYPNTQYAKGRRPVDSSPQFPFPNCYFWIQSTMTLRVRVKRGLDGYDNEKATTVSIARHTALRTAWNEDSLRMYSLRRAESPQSSAAASHTPAAHHSASSSLPSSPPTLREYPESSILSHEEDFAPDLSPQKPSQSGGSPADGGAGSAPAPKPPPIPPLLEMAIDRNIFGWAADPKVPFVPLVDLWFELEEHLSPDNIPSPTELWKEQETIGVIIEAALRRWAIATAPSQAPSRGVDPQKSHDGVVVSPGHAAAARDPSQSDTHNSKRWDEAQHSRLQSPSPTRRSPPPSRTRRETVPSPVLKPKPDSDEAHKAQAPSFASLFQSSAPLGNHIASWDFRPPLKSALPAPMSVSSPHNPNLRSFKKRARALRQQQYRAFEESQGR